MKCPNCHGCGTVWPTRKSLTTLGAKPCPVCKGSCKVPDKEKK